MDRRSDNPAVLAGRPADGGRRITRRFTVGRFSVGRFYCESSGGDSASPALAGEVFVTGGQGAVGWPTVVMSARRLCYLWGRLLVCLSVSSAFQRKARQSEVLNFPYKNPATINRDVKDRPTNAGRCLQRISRLETGGFAR